MTVKYLKLLWYRFLSMVKLSLGSNRVLGNAKGPFGFEAFFKCLCFPK